jgi:7-cyano-7-deazaguanine synthase
MKAVVLLSGGLDSTTVLAIARSEGYECHTLAFDYGQRHRIELERARVVSSRLGAVRHVTVRLDLSAFGGSALTDDIAVPKDGVGVGIPVTYVPARNTVFLSVALGWAEVLGAQDIFIGVNALDYSGYPDCRLEFIAAFEQMANLATKAGVEGNRFRTGQELGVDYGLTISCYDPAPDGTPCGSCDSCRLRAKGFAEAGLVDPLGR